MSALKEAGMDEKKRKRMISNRESARRSRMRKQEQVRGLTDEASRLKMENNSILGKIDSITAAYMICTAENNVLTAKATELTERLRFLNDVIQKKSGLLLPVEETPEMLLLNPWQQQRRRRLHRPMQPIAASSGLFFGFE